MEQLAAPGTIFMTAATLRREELRLAPVNRI
jgi:hypothetical protein